MDLHTLVLNYEQYARHPFAQNKKPTYTYTLEKGDKVLCFFGATHTNDPLHPIFNEIKNLFDVVKPDMVYVEGYRYANTHKQELIRELQAETPEHSKIQGESHFTLKLASDSGIAFTSPEPEFSQEISHIVAKGFSKRDIFCYYIYRMIAQYQRTTKKVDIHDCEQYLTRSIDSFKSLEGWDTAEINVFKKEIFDTINLLDLDTYRNETNPVPRPGTERSTIQKVSAESGDFRDSYILDHIYKDLQNHNKIFIVYGSSHAVRLEPALRALFAILKP